MSRQSEEVEICSKDGVKIRFCISGSGDTALLFIHCWLCNRSFWDRQVTAFADHFTTMAVDLGGHGNSGVGRQVWSVSAFANDVQAVVDTLAPKRVIFVDTLHDMELKPTAASAEAMMAPFLDDYAGAVRSAFAGRLSPSCCSEVLDWIVDQSLRVDPAIGISSMEGMAEYDVRAAAQALSIPIRAVNGSQRPTNESANRRMLADYDVVVMEDVGHFPHLEKPDLFNQRLQETLDSLGV